MMHGKTRKERKETRLEPVNKREALAQIGQGGKNSIHSTK
jgi:hypothetical protein